MLHARRKRRAFLAAVTGIVMIVAVVLARRPGTPPPLQVFRIILGLEDKTETAWNGKVTVADGEVADLAGWRFEDKDTILDEKDGWECKTHKNIAPLKRYPVQDAEGKPKGKPDLKPWPNGVDLTVRGAKPTITVKLEQGEVKFAAADVLLGQPKTFLEGKVRVERLPLTRALRPPAPGKVEGARQDDYPAFWVRYKTNKHYLAWVSYEKEKDRVLLAQRDGPHGEWTKPLEVAGPGQHFRVALAGTHDDTLWIVWSSQRNANWDLYARPYQDGKLGKEIRLTDAPGPDIWHRMTTDKKGRAWLVWQGFRDGQSDIFARCADCDGWHDPIKVSTSKANDWDPCIAADAKEDRVWVGWDSYETESYGVRIRSLSGGPNPKLGEVQIPEETPLFSAHVSLASDKEGRLWAAWDVSGEQWGKDTGFLYGGGKRKDTTRLYSSRSLRVKCLVGDTWMEPRVDVNDIMPPEMKEYNELPQLQGDSEGRMWLAFRHRFCRQPREDGWASKGRWDLYVTAYLGNTWMPPVELLQSGGRNDMRTSSQRDAEGNVFFAYASDHRNWKMPVMPPRNHSINVSQLAGAAPPGKMVFIPVERTYVPSEKVHPKEKEQVARIRNYKINLGGKTYRIYRGDLHRHTDISGDGPGDGTLMDLHRYALDAAALDFVMVTDHNMGNDNEYCWWRTQQANDLYTVPGTFISVYGYERSVKYPNGHRNVLWTERGHRTLPLPKPVPAGLAGDTAKLYEYLRKTGGICTLHTSATDQGTDWKDPHDPELEPIVELFQGYHTSYELPGAPKTVNDETDRIHGPYRGDGFVTMALDKGYKMGFQSSSDHISTHVSYCCVLAEEFSRTGLVAAMKKRHTYAATDNMILDVRMGSHLMGDEVATAKPSMDIVALGTGVIDKVEVLRNGKVVHTHQPKKGAEEARFSWEDPDPKGAVSYYYVRVMQKDGQMAWSSPFWVKTAK
jgi:hypothetical protein